MFASALIAVAAGSGGWLAAYYLAEPGPLVPDIAWPAWLLLLGSAALFARWMARKQHPLLRRCMEFLSPRSHSGKLVSRWGEVSRAQHGLASRREVRRYGGRAAVRKKTANVRPSIAALDRWARLRSATSEVGVELARAGWRRVWASVEDVTLLFAGPRVGKTGWMKARVADAPGACVATSTRDDLYRDTWRHRARRGPVWVFNAAGFPLVDNPVAFDPLTGCEHPDVASARAADMIPLGDGERADWNAKGRTALGSLMHAAALGRAHTPKPHSMDTVHRWVADPDRHRDDIIRLLREHSPMPASAVGLEHFLNTNDRTRSSITTSIVPALKWLETPAARAAAGMDGAELPAFDARAMVDAGAGTLYILGVSDENTHVTPLMAALAGHIATVARDVARRRAARLDPPLRMCLDEAAKVAPPLPQWSTDLGGTGVTIIAAFQSLADLRLVWGKDGAARLMNNSATKLLGGGTGDPDDLHTWVELVGNRDERVHTYDAGGRVTATTTRSVPVLTPSQLAHLPDRTVVVFRRGMRPTVGRLRMAWETPWDTRLLGAARRALGHRGGRRLPPAAAAPPIPAQAPAPSRALPAGAAGREPVREQADA